LRSIGGAWNSGSIAPGGTFPRTFSSAGTFQYHCTIHPGMVGTVNVQSVACSNAMANAATGIVRLVRISSCQGRTPKGSRERNEVLWRAICKLPGTRAKYAKAAGPALALRLCELRNAMGTRATVVLYVVLMIAVIVAVDFLFFRNRFGERLTVNIGIVLVFAAFYLRFLKRP
jgi:copper binding plastocyanin/azurin family protein